VANFAGPEHGPALQDRFDTRNANRPVFPALQLHERRSGPESLRSVAHFHEHQSDREILSEPGTHLVLTPPSEPSQNREASAAGFSVGEWYKGFMLRYGFLE
jgi:hypothetical protein